MPWTRSLRTKSRRSALAVLKCRRARCHGIRSALMPIPPSYKREQNQTPRERLVVFFWQTMGGVLRALIAIHSIRRYRAQKVLEKITYGDFGVSFCPAFEGSITPELSNSKWAESNQSEIRMML